MTDVLKELVELAERCTPEADSQLREKMQKVAEYEKHPDFDMKDVLGCMDAICHNAAVYLRIVKAARKALPALKALLSQEAELRELERKWREEAMSYHIENAKSDSPKPSEHVLIARVAVELCADELSAIIRRHHES